jgi:hypothetical protein
MVTVNDALTLRRSHVLGCWRRLRPIEDEVGEVDMNVRRMKLQARERERERESTYRVQATSWEIAS